jgi:hypothetical protein
VERCHYQPQLLQAGHPKGNSDLVYCRLMALKTFLTIGEKQWALVLTTQKGVAGLW